LSLYGENFAEFTTYNTCINNKHIDGEHFAEFTTHNTCINNKHIDRRTTVVSYSK